MADGNVAVAGLEKNFKLIKQGAEAKLYKGIYLGRPTIVKERFKKSYRHVDLDNRLTRERMKSEARAIVKCKAAGNSFLFNFFAYKNNIFILWNPISGGRFYCILACLVPELFHISVGNMKTVDGKIDNIFQRDHCKCLLKCVFKIVFASAY
jgi:tRNA A-37 threonylcarbamoyl transferase component Bud32